MLTPLELTVPASIGDTGIKNKLFQSRTKRKVMTFKRKNG